MGSYASKHKQMTVCDVHHMYNMHHLLYMHDLCIMPVCMMAHLGASAHSTARTHTATCLGAHTVCVRMHTRGLPGFDPGLLTRACIYRVLPPHKYRRYSFGPRRVSDRRERMSVAQNKTATGFAHSGQEKTFGTAWPLACGYTKVEKNFENTCCDTLVATTV